MQTLALQNDIYEWCRDHRVHHKFSETDADPLNSKRGFFFARMGWLLVKKHPQIKQKGKTVGLFKTFIITKGLAHQLCCSHFWQ
jgi:stearoyl-CoA desaturase (delta-9 desaturase)